MPLELSFRRKHEYDRIGAANERLDALPPIFKSVNLLPVDERFKTSRLKRCL